jgi:hypothetical protein
MFIINENEVIDYEFQISKSLVYNKKALERRVVIYLTTQYFFIIQELHPWWNAVSKLQNVSCEKVYLLSVKAKK